MIHSFIYNILIDNPKAQYLSIKICNYKSTGNRAPVTQNNLLLSQLLELFMQFR